MVEVGGHDLGPGLALERIPAGQGEIVNAADRVHVQAGVDRPALEQFRRHVEDRAEDRVVLFEVPGRGGGSEVGEAEVDDLGLEASGRQPVEHDVRGLEVAVDQAEVLGGDERFLDLEDQFAEIRPGERGFFDDLVEGLAAEQFHHHEGAVLVGSDVEDRDDVRMLERGEGAGFLLHLAGGFLALGVVVAGEDPLHRDLAFQGVVPGTIDGTKPALA